jgi:hypothetical protein
MMPPFDREGVQELGVMIPVMLNSVLAAARTEGAQVSNTVVDRARAHLSMMGRSLFMYSLFLERRLLKQLFADSVQSNDGDCGLECN